jgi:hypothetical protein
VKKGIEGEWGIAFPFFGFNVMLTMKTVPQPDRRTASMSETGVLLYKESEG